MSPNVMALDGGSREKIVLRARTRERIALRARTLDEMAFDEGHSLVSRRFVHIDRCRARRRFLASDDLLRSTWKHE